MEIPKRINGKECQNLIVNTIAAFNVVVRSFSKIHPEMTIYNADRFIEMFAGQSICTDQLLTLAKIFCIEAEYSEEEDTILVDGKLCFSPVK